MADYVISDLRTSPLVLAELGNVTVEEHGSIAVTGAGENGIRTNFPVVLQVKGTVSSALNTAVWSDAQATVDVSSGGTISGASDGLKAGSGSSITNSGAISGGINGLNIQSMKTAPGKVINKGTISGGTDSGIVAAGAGLIINEGIIRGKINGILIREATDGGGRISILNTGTIEGGASGVVVNDEIDAVLLNSGQITGGIFLTNRGDWYFGRTGTVTGAIHLQYGNDTAYGGAGAETFVGGEGDDLIDGGGGNDTAVFETARTENTIVHKTDGSVVIIGAEGTDTLVNVRFAKFSDQTVVLTNVVPAGLVLSAGAMTEDVQVGATVAALSATDADGDAVSYSLISDANGTFKLEGNNLVLVKGLDYETQVRQHSVMVEAKDIYGGTTTQTFTLDVLNVIETTPFTLTGTAAADGLAGEAGNDMILGLAGHDRLSGEAGDDRLYGGVGKDLLTGGAGRDVFVFDAKPNKRTNLDAITDFTASDDTIWLKKSVFSKIGKKGTLKKAFFHVGKKAHDDDDRIVYNKKTGALYYDQDGEGGRAQVQIAKLLNKTKISEKDFFII